MISNLFSVPEAIETASVTRRKTFNNFMTDHFEWKNELKIPISFSDIYILFSIQLISSCEGLTLFKFYCGETHTLVHLMNLKFPDEFIYIIFSKI